VLMSEFKKEASEQLKAMPLNWEYIARLFSYLLLKYTSFQACIIYTLNATKPASPYRHRFLFRHGTFRHCQKIPAHLYFWEGTASTFNRESHSKQRTRKAGVRLGLGEGSACGGRTSSSPGTSTHLGTGCFH